MNPETCEPLPLPSHHSFGGGNYGGCSIDGDIKLKNFSPEYVMEMYLKTSVQHTRNSLTDNFFSHENVHFIIKEIAKVLKKLTNGQNVRIPFNDELVQTMWQVASDNLGLTYVPGAVALLNRAVIEHEANILYSSLIRRKLWIKYYLKQDRMRVFPYGQLTKDTKGEETVSTSGYMLSNPWARNRNCYLYATEGLRCDKQGQYQLIDGFLQPKKAPPGAKRANQEPHITLGGSYLHTQHDGKLGKGPANYPFYPDAMHL